MTSPNHNQAQHLARILLTQPTEQDCQACLDVLDAYIGAQLAGQPYQTEYPQVAQHLDSCVACAESYAVLYESYHAAASLPTPAHIPQPDLRFLQQTAAEQLAELLGQASEWLGDQLRITFSQALFGLLPPTPALAVRGSTAVPDQDFTITLGTGQFSQVRVQIYRHETANTADLHLQLSMPNREWPDLAGIKVTVIAAGQQTTDYSDPYGEVVFRTLPLPALASLQITIAV
jgi:hypothetical protein